MLQLVQSPSARVQRLIKEECNSSAGQRPNSRPEVKVRAKHGEEVEVLPSDEVVKGESNGESSVLSSFSSSPSDGKSSKVFRISRVTNGRTGVVVASSSSSTSNGGNIDDADDDDDADTTEAKTDNDGIDDDYVK